MSESKRTDPIQGEIVHEYDGILEADNRLPNWWLATFFGGIVFAVGYWFVYQSWKMAPTPLGEYAAAMEAAAASGGEVTDELLLLVASDGERVESGHRTFTSTCAACHGASGEGLIGPNLTDAHWIHGGAPAHLHATVRNGVTTAGMPAWGAVLGEREVQSVVAYLLSIRDTNLAGREPQGEVWVPGAEPTTEATEANDAPDEENDSPSADAPSVDVPAGAHAAVPPPV